MGMTTQELRDSGWLMYEVHAGSHLYGISGPTSDIDVRGVYNVPLHKYLCPGWPTKIVVQSEEDATFMEIVTYLKLVTDGNPNVIDWLYVDTPIYNPPLGGLNTLREMREEFITKRMLHKSLAMGQSMLKRCKKKEEKQWKMLSHAQRILFTVYTKLAGPYKTYSPELVGYDKELCLKIKNADPTIDYWKMVSDLDMGLESWFDKIREAEDIADEFPKEKLNSLIQYYKLDEIKTTRREDWKIS